MSKILGVVEIPVSDIKEIQFPLYNKILLFFKTTKAPFLQEYFLFFLL